MLPAVSKEIGTAGNKIVNLGFDASPLCIKVLGTFCRSRAGVLEHFIVKQDLRPAKVVLFFVWKQPEWLPPARLREGPEG